MSWARRVSSVAARGIRVANSAVENNFVHPVSFVQQSTLDSHDYSPAGSPPDQVRLASTSNESSSRDTDRDGDQPSASFGYRTVPESDKARLVSGVFSSVATKYDVMNDLMSLGLHRLWKDRLVSDLRPFPGMSHLDVAGGTGDIAFRVLGAIQEAEKQPLRRGHVAPAENDEDEEGGVGTSILVCDINEDMLAVGRNRAEEKGLGSDPRLRWVQGDAEDLHFMPDASVDGYSIAFGIRNVTRIDKALAEAYRVLKPGGHFICLELSHLETRSLQPVYDACSFSFIPAMGEVVTGDRASYQYLVESIRKFPNQMNFAHMIQQAGFKRVRYENLAGGVVAIHSGFKL